MKFFTGIPKNLEPYFKKELELYAQQFSKNNFQKAWNHLERAHIIGQRYPYSHTLAHWKMLVFGFKIKNIKEIAGQFPRLLVGGVKSFVGKIPTGNPGGSNVSPLKPFPIDKEIMEIFKKAGIQTI